MKTDKRKMPDGLQLMKISVFSQAAGCFLIEKEGRTVYILNCKYHGGREKQV
ncbi:MAG: hypothetical protein LIO99_08805 [Clostridiales bacterium]|nr:hypothetical protein [Clostridiales bacterium]